MNFSRKSITITLVFCLTFAVITTLLIEQLTKNPIAQVIVNKHRKRVEQMMPLPYSNELFADKVELHALGDLGTSEAVQVYRARMTTEENTQQAIGVVLTPTAPDGYNGPIKLALSLNYKGEVLKVNILQHQETESFGTQIHQDNSDWLQRFTGKSAKDFEEDVTIDQISGASVSSHSVTQAIIKSLNLYQRAPELFWAEASE